MKTEINTQEAPEKAILVGVHIGKIETERLSTENSLEELALLADTDGLEVAGTLTQNLPEPDSRTYIGKGKVEELKLLAGELDADVVVFDNELSPRHQRELEADLGEKLRVIDRTALILDIFALHAHTREGILQVELAQLQYRLPRLTRAWTHLARQAGGGGGRTGSVGGVGLRGPGETQLEVDRREIKHKIARLKDDLDKVSKNRSSQRSHRRKTDIPVVALVGYTNAGKSTLLNKLTHADIPVADQLFATLDPTTRQLELPSGQNILLTDTVGFIQKLPTQLIASFHATLEEIIEADLLLHIVDASHADFQAQRLTVLDTLKEIGAGDIPILTVFNKIDLLDEAEKKALKLVAENGASFISAKSGEGLEKLMSAISSQLYVAYSHLSVLLPFDQGQLVSIFYEKGHVEKVETTQNGIRITGMIPKPLEPLFLPFSVKPKSS